MADIQLKTIKYNGDYDNPGYEDPSDGLPPYDEKGKNGAAHTYSPTDASHVTIEAKSFSPNGPSPVTHTRKDHGDDGDGDIGDDDFEDLPPLESPFLQGIMDAQDSLWKFTSDHSQPRSILFWVVLLALYFAYFIYALLYHFGDEGSIRLLWVTMVVIFCFFIWLIKKYCGDAIWTCMEPLYLKLEPHGLKINYAILALVYVFIIIFVIVDVVWKTKNYYNLVSISGIVIYVFLFFIFSKSPAHVNWRAVLWGLALQFILAIIILRTYWGYNAFKWLGDRISEFLEHTDAGSMFLFGEAYVMHYFAFKVLPVIIFFSTAVSVLFYLGWMQVVIKKVSWVMQVTMGTTAGESLNAAGNIFIGQSEAPLLIRPLINDMTCSEIHAVMTGGFATIAGSVLAAYILMGIPSNHLLSASVMSAPAALAMSKLFWPETKKSRTTADDVDKMEKPQERNIIEAMSAGASASISLVANIAANLIAFIAALHFVNATLTWFGERVGKYGEYPPTHEDITLEWFCSYLLIPFAFIMGTEWTDCRNIAQLIGVKTIINEFVAYDFHGTLVSNTGYYEYAQEHNYTTYFEDRSLLIANGADFISMDALKPGQGTLMADNSTVVLVAGVMSQRSIVIGTYALCGFANFGSMGIMLGALGAMAPRRKKDFSRVVVRAMIAGNVACFMTAAIAGLFYTDAY